jgi:hypothetical protein
VKIMLDVLVHLLRVTGLVNVRLHEGNSIAVSQGVVIRLARHEDPSCLSEIPVAQADTFFRAVAGQGTAWERLRSFHPALALPDEGHVPVVRAPDGRTVWAWRPTTEGGELVIGTDLIGDIVLLRQGDPNKAATRPTEPQWGYAGERPTYLFEGQLVPEQPSDRMADWWIWTLRDALIRHGGVAARDVLPFGAPGAVVVTGDDDQAALSDYAAQARKLGRLPVTYFLHPLAKHDAGSILAHAHNRAVEWELHPDALDAPDQYGALLRAQADWFTLLVGRRPRLVRNHGFLNDGYWGHATHWLREGIIGSSNLPGVDGRVLNGSLLPARLVLDGVLTAHWSQLTAFGDGVFFVSQWGDDDALDAIATMGRNIIESGVPGLVVLNLHPANHEKAAAMHEAAHRLVDDFGFCAMTLGDAFAWFSARDELRGDASTERMIAPSTDTRVAAVSETETAGMEAPRKPDGIAQKAIDMIIRLTSKRGAA